MMRTRRRERVADVLARFSLSGRLARLRSQLCLELPILAYHRVWDLQDEDDFPFDPELISATPEAFRAQMRYVRDHFDPIVFRDLARWQDGAAPLPERPIIVTFDDGYEDNYTQAFPVLRELGVPATVFMASDYIGGDETFWYDRLAYALYRAERGFLDIPGAPMRVELGDVQSRRRATYLAIRALRSMTDDARRGACHELFGRLGPLLPEDLPLSRPMTWDQAREMHEAGVEFGSHTASHPVLSRCEDDRVDAEMTRSSLRIRDEIGEAPTVVAYPFGGPREFNTRTMEAAAVAGFRFGVSYIGGVDPLPDTSAFDLRRVHIERRTTLSDLEAALALPRIFATA